MMAMTMGPDSARTPSGATSEAGPVLSPTFQMRKVGLEEAEYGHLLMREGATLDPEQPGVEIQLCVFKHLFCVISSFIHPIDISMVEAVCQRELFTGDVGGSR